MGLNSPCKDSAVASAAPRGYPQLRDSFFSLLRSHEAFSSFSLRSLRTQRLTSSDLVGGMPLPLACAFKKEQRTFSADFPKSRERISEVGISEQADLVELFTIHYIPRTVFVDAAENEPFKLSTAGLPPPASVTGSLHSRLHRTFSKQRRNAYSPLVWTDRRSCSEPHSFFDTGSRSASLWLYLVALFFVVTQGTEIVDTM